MTDTQTRNAEKIVEDLKTCGFTVEQVANDRWRVTDPTGNQRATFVPGKLENKNVKPMIDRLTKSGYPTANAAQIRDDNHRRAVIDAARRAEEEIRRAEERAAAQAAEAEAIRQFTAEVEEFNRVVAAEKLAAGATLVDSKVRFDIIELDAEFARDLLRHNRDWKPGVTKPPTHTNRPLSMPHVYGLRDEMLAGNWVLVPQGIALDTEGNLLDGQHRLHALLLADEVQPGITILMVISYDWDPAVFDRIDQGRNRSLSDLLGLLGEGNRHLFGSAMRLAYRYDDSPELKGWSNIKVSDHALLNWLEASDQDAKIKGYPNLRDTVNYASTVARGCKMVGSSAVVGMFVCQRAWPEGPHREFAEGLRLGHEVLPSGRLTLPDGDPRTAFRSYLISNGRKRGNGVNAHQLALYIKTYTLWVLRRKVQIVRLGPNELFPVPPNGPIK